MIGRNSQLGERELSTKSRPDVFALMIKGGFYGRGLKFSRE